MSAPTRGSSARRVALMTREGYGMLESAVRLLVAACLERGVELCAVRGDIGSADLEASGLLLIDHDPREPSVDLVVTLGGDGTILRALRAFAGTGVPVFALNFGQVGFLATAEADDLAGTFGRALDGEFECLDVPAVTVHVDGEEAEHFGVNDVSLHRQTGTRVAELGYGVDGAIIGAVRCDGLVACTPAGSTGYNLAGGGPIMAWGVAGYGVSFIAPHSLTARSIVAAPTDQLIVENRGQGALDVLVDGRETGVELRPGRRAVLGYRTDAAVLAQLPGATFYARLREKFGHLRG
ncbi:MAG: NAD(+)/NADH kinase [Solirubrobacteraceae bacterium]|nr:NAD(+)/NADH kinase [Solirubrobacteraceae bacterium]